MTARHRRLFSDQDGAVLVETLVTLVPLLVFFLAVLQLLEICAGSLIVKRAASAAARAAIVVLPDSDEYYDSPVNTWQGQRRQEVTEAARMILRTNTSFDADAANVDVTPVQNHDPLTATVRARFKCGVICLGGSVELSGSATHIYQGAQYIYDFFSWSDYNPVR
jgi:Flp pilus assembly protein TadG